MNSTPAAQDALSALRGRIDALDAQLLTLLAERARLAQEIGEHKKHLQLNALDAAREGEVLRRLQAMAQTAQHPLSAGSIEDIWRSIMSACRALEERERVAFLGPPGTYSEEAALRFFGEAMQGVPSADIDEVFRSVVSGAADYGVAALENSTEGAIARTLDLLLQAPLTIIGEVRLSIHHCLLCQGSAPQMICAHPQALAQCRGWLAQHYPRAQTRAVSSNAEGARLASTDAQCAAIAGERAARLFNLDIIARNIEDNPGNFTRFIILARPEGHFPAAPSGHDCTSLVVGVPNRPGAMVDLLLPLKRHGVSMSRIESRPAHSGHGTKWEYHFFIDLVGHACAPPLALALDELRAAASFCKVLGSYATDAAL